MNDFFFQPEQQPGSPDFSDLPWEISLESWPKNGIHLEEVQHGISRHPVMFANYDGVLFALKELPEGVASKEYELLVKLEKLKLPAVKPVGFAAIHRSAGNSSVLFTRYLEASVPYRTLFINKSIDLKQTRLLDAIAGLLVQLHSNGFFWGDCSLSNILFRHDAGALQAYLVDAETAELQLPPISPVLRYSDLEIMQENIEGELIDLQNEEFIPFNFPIQETSHYIQQRYRSLWEEITREEVFSDTELYRVQDRVRKLNELGFSIKDIQLKNEDHGNSLKLRVFVSDRSFHHDQLMEITGLRAEDHQAQQIMNEIYEVKANLSQTVNPNISLEAAAYHWLEHIYKPVIEQVKPMINKSVMMEADPIEVYCRVLEHKWYLSERAHHDVGHQYATTDFIQQFGQDKNQSKLN